MSHYQAKISLIITLIIAFVPYFKKLVTKSDYTVQNISPVCIQTWSNKSQPPIRLCLSCFERDLSHDLSGLGLWVNDHCDESIDSKIYRSINSIVCDPLQETEKIKKIVTFSTDFLTCEEIVQMFDYSPLKTKLADHSVQNIGFQTIKPIQQIVNKLNLTISQSTNKNSLHINRQTGNFGILQVTSQQRQIRSLVEIQVPSMESIYFMTATLSILALSISIFIFTLFFIKLAISKQCQLQMFVNILCLVGLMYSLHFNKFEQTHNTFMMMDIEVLWVCILLTKLKMENVLTYSVAIIGVLLCVIISANQSLGFSRSYFLVAATCLILSKGKQKSQSESMYIYLAPCVFIVTITTMWLSLNEDISCYYVKYVIMILSMGLMEVSETLKIQQFQQYVENASNLMKEGKGFQKVQEYELDEEEGHEIDKN